MDATGQNEAQAAIKFAMDLSPWSPVPWTSPLSESIESMANVVRQFNNNGLIQAWRLSVSNVKGVGYEWNFILSGPPTTVHC